MKTSLDVYFTPAEFARLRSRDLSQSVCVVFDILRATSTMVTALANGAAAILPVAEISDALAIRIERPEVLLAGEREGLRILSSSSGGVDFDLGNSPREFTPDRVQDKTIVMTTTNGTRALQACAHASTVLVGSFLNLSSVAQWIQAQVPAILVLVCAGTVDECSLEDSLAAGALCDLIWPVYGNGQVTDSANIARQVYRTMQNDLPGAMQQARNGRRLLGIAELAGDVPACLQRNTLNFVAALQSDGAIRRVSEKAPE
jgi:2-phosphosulfolactate phosphatase